MFRLEYDDILRLPHLVGKEVILPVKPNTSPRMTQRDKWQNPPRKCVAQYRAYKAALGAAWPAGVLFPTDVVIVRFCIPMPDSWSKKKKEEMNGQRHESKPDIDNLLKALFDAILIEDKTISGVFAEKRWTKEGSIQIITYEQDKKVRDGRDGAKS